MIFLSLDNNPNVLCIKHSVPMHIYPDGTSECSQCTLEAFAELSQRLKKEIKENNTGIKPEYYEN